jgi:hypothetical protein
MPDTATPAAETGLSDDLEMFVAANIARAQEVDALTRTACGGDPRDIEAFRARLRLTALALDIPEAEIAPFLKAHPRTVGSTHWFMTKLLPWCEDRDLSIDWLWLGSVESLIRIAYHARAAS